MSVVISFINLKGGTGKTLMTMMFGEMLADKLEASKRVLLVDLDSQSNLTSGMLHNDAGVWDGSLSYRIQEKTPEAINQDSESLISHRRENGPCLVRSIRAVREAAASVVPGALPARASIWNGALSFFS